MTDSDLLCMFLFEEITEENVYWPKDGSIKELIDFVDEDDYEFFYQEEVVGVDRAKLKDSDNHTRKFSVTSNNVHIEYTRFGNFISGMDIEDAEIRYVGSVESQERELIEYLERIGILFKEGSSKSSQLPALMKSIKYSVELWEEIQ